MPIAHPASRRRRSYVAVTELVCTACGTRGTHSATATACPSCAGTTWEPAPWRPFSRGARRAARANGASTAR